MLREAMQRHDVQTDALSKPPSSGAATEAALRGGARLLHASKDSRSSASNASNPAATAAATAAATLSGGCHESKSSFGGSGSKGFVDGNVAPASFFRGGCALDETTRQQYALLWKDGAADLEASRPVAAAAAAAAAAQASAKPQRKAWNKGLKSQNHKSKDSAKTTSTAAAAIAAAAATSSASLALASSAHARPDAGMLTYADVC